MLNLKRHASFALALVCAVLAAASSMGQESNRDKLAAHTEEFRQEVIEVTDGIYVAIGFALGWPSAECSFALHTSVWTLATSTNP